MIELFFKIIVKIFLLFIATIFLYGGIALFIAFITKNKGRAGASSMARANIPGRGVSYHKMPDWFAGIIMATIFAGLGFGLIYYVMYFFWH